ncbi:MAG TPA: double-strand break repair helicase AddA [Acidiphilium sp.]|nr:MAG: double-strand break repair helicase AddA [Acidiphilium sp. 21-60-14]OYV91295.1 MAG: double-strand break repair helicase AddA [Acidiphilium sp. 37-60-79]HQT88827.1 double-strand break repair helicase AddA [Acidiphilium sp.]HQU23733.1 double-strand break repair helicase AddA [Acidiphilium sp.]
MSNAIAHAEAAQRAAANPLVSAFVAASAGSGKTKLLTDRLLRLMLEGANPARILCLTFTRAAAAEMAIRLRNRLGLWVTLGDALLDGELAKLDVAASAANRARARALFGQVLDLPGGMRIDTIHAFCQSLLRRFPLEAGITPHFAVSDDAQTSLRRRAAREAVLGDKALEPTEALLRLAGEISETQFAALIDQLLTDQRTQLAHLLAKHGAAPAIKAEQRAALNAPDQDAEALTNDAIQGTDNQPLRAALQRIAAASSPKAQEKADQLLDILAKPVANRAADWATWCGLFLTSAGKPRALSAFISKALNGSDPDLAVIIEAEQARILRYRDQCAALVLAALSGAMIDLLLPIRNADIDAKIQESRFDYADLIARAAQLLQNPGAAWVLYKLDGGLDHILLDEVQDIAPAQWQVINQIAAEFFAGYGTRADERLPRSIFAVGDRKQSIYSFQGANLAVFDQWRRHIGRRVTDAQARWHDGTLDTSFRSTAPILQLVDQVFADDLACRGVAAPGASLAHGISRAGQAGSATLWPLVPAEPEPALGAWQVADHYLSQSSARRRLANGIAAWIAAQIGVMALPARDRLLQAGDILILVRSRNEFGPALTRALKDHGVPVAGLDRMVLTETRAVADLIALLQALLLPEDDVSVATFLTSPLGGLSDEALMRLAIGRIGSLREALARSAAQNADYRAAEDLFARLQKRVDFVSPYQLLAEIIGPLGGRARLLARLGPEAAEPIDELLAAAIDFSASNPPSLQAFLAELDASAAEIKREAEAAGNSVRLMTVHGAKGLQAPVVILPDTTSTPRTRDTLHWLTAPQSDRDVPIFSPRADQRSSAVIGAVEAAKTAMVEEYNRLLYVALTRAEDHLIVCGAAPKNAPPNDCWYQSVQRAFARLGAAAQAVPIALPWASEALTSRCAQTAPPDRPAPSDEARRAALPAWVGGANDWQATPPPPPSDPIDRLVPSRSAEGAETGLAAASPRRNRTLRARNLALARGRLVHALLQHLPDLPADHRAEAARRYLAQPGHGLDQPSQSRLLQDVMRILDHPEMLPLFAPGSRAEAPIAGIVGRTEIGGLIDRLAITPERIMFADYKTDRAPPASEQLVPPAYRAQLSAYASVLRAIHPNRPVTAILVWTSTGTVMPISL